MDRERATLTLTDLGELGEAFARHNDRPAFIAGGIPGEEVVAEVWATKRKRLVGEVVEVLSPSPHRTTPPCPYFGPCSGCQWQHITYERQLELKRGIIEKHLAEAGLDDVPVQPTIPSPKVWGYRNHARFTVGPEGRLGFVNRHTRRFVAIDRCLLMDEAINTTLARLQGRCAETTQLSVRCGVNTGDVIIQPTLKNPDIPVPSGQHRFTESLLGHRFQIADSSFFQVNTLQAEAMARYMRQHLPPATGALVDAYAGVGTFAALLAGHVRKVLAIEESASAVENARANVAALSNVYLVQGKTEEVLPQLDYEIDALILDPPRGGCKAKALEAVLRLAPQRVLYISCEPVPLARDLKLLESSGYRIAEVQPFDMFPHTHHVEAVAMLVREG